MLAEIRAARADGSPRGGRLSFVVGSVWSVRDEQRDARRELRQLREDQRRARLLGRNARSSLMLIGLAAVLGVVAVTQLVGPTREGWGLLLVAIGIAAAAGALLVLAVRARSRG